MNVESHTAFQLTSSKGHFKDFGGILSCRGIVLLWGQMHGYEQGSLNSERIRSKPGQVSMKMSSILSTFTAMQLPFLKFVLAPCV